MSGDDRTSGVWVPKGPGADFRTHDPDRTVVYVGPGHAETDWADSGELPFRDPLDYVEVLLKYQLRGKLPVGELYTTTVLVPGHVVFGNGPERSKFEHLLDRLQELVAQGRVVAATFRQVVAAWQTTYHCRPNVVPFDTIETWDYTGGN